MSHSPGNLFVIAAPSGTGKTTLVKALVDSMPGVTVSISHTTRLKRPQEQDGVNYYFIANDQFHEMIAHQDFLEYATVFNHLYGTSRTWVQQTLEKGLDVILEIDWQGCQQIKKLFPQCISIFILPPSLDDLSERLQLRNQDHPNIIKQRLADVKETISHIKEYEYVIVNAVFNQAVVELKTIIDATRLLQKKQVIKYETLLSDLIKIE